MEKIDELMELQEKRKAAFEQFKTNEKEVAERLANLIKVHCAPDGFELDIQLEMRTEWRRNENSRYYFGGSVAFLTDDPERLKKGWKTDFGSNFDLSIHEYGIEINKGTCGSYTRKDKYQVARDIMLAKVWENEDVLVAYMTNHFDYNLHVNYYNIDNQISRINEDLKRAEEQRQFEETLKTLRGAKYLYKHSVNDKYKDDDYWSHEKIGVHHHFYNMLVITKITDKTVLCYDENYKWVNKRIPLGSVIYDLQHGILHCSAERPEDYDELDEGKGE